MHDTKANYLCRSGVHSFVNNEKWAFPYLISEYPETEIPTYPDGSEAVRYPDGAFITLKIPDTEIYGCFIIGA